MQSRINKQESNESNNQVPCVRILNLKIIDGYDTQRHLDTILIQCIPRVGPINRIYVCNNLRFSQAQHNNSELAHIDLSIDVLFHSKCIHIAVLRARFIS